MEPGSAVWAVFRQPEGVAAVRGSVEGAAASGLLDVRLAGAAGAAGPLASIHQ